MATTVRQYIAWAEKRIAALVVAEGLHCGLLGAVQGALTITYRVRLLQPTPSALKRLLSMGPALSQALQCEAVRVVDTAGAVLIEIPSPVQRTPTALELAAATAGVRACVGVDSLRKPIHVDLQQHGAIFWIGPSRRGKTQSMKSTLFALALTNGSKRLRYVILSQKRADWAAFENADTCLGIVSQAGEALTVLRWAADLARQRAESAGGGRYVIVCDDLLNLLSAEPSMAEPLAELASMGAGLGVHLLAGTQEGGSRRGTGGGGVENNATARILYRNSNAAAAARSAGQSGEGVQSLSGAKGDALLIVDGYSTRIATGWADDAEILSRLPQGGEHRRSPWRNRVQQPQQAQQPAAATLTGAHVDDYASSVGAGVVAVAPVVSVAAQRAAALFPIERRAPTVEESAVIAELAAEGMSLKRLSITVYGHRDGKTHDWVRTAAQSATKSAESAESNLEIDLGTDMGKEAMRALLASQAIDWRRTAENLRAERLTN